ncbi:YadA domain-containing protein [Caballeronia telluris]|uniref:YadA domain-containing protein n=1 Tax=Caballeronia telluris TaxID=326475 RepID=A0A158JMC4_9BURK|nr:YadA domain-containing protein [Caballeronia telluris]
MAVGANAIAGADQAVSVGYGTFASGVQSAAFGYNANTISDRGLAMGNLAQINDSSPDAIAIGTRTQVNNDSAIGIGRDNLVNGLKSVVLGNDSTADGDGTFVIGNSVTKSTGKNSVVLGSGSDGSMDNVVSVGAKGSERKIVNVATGTAGTDAVNVAQLNAQIAAIPSSPDAVKYDTSAHDKLTLGGKGSTTPVTLSNVAAGKADTDAVNVKQLTDAGLTTDSSGNLTNAFVAYDNTTKAAISLGGSSGTQIHNVTAGTAAKDAVNLAQLNALGATVDSLGNVTNSFVAYDDTTKGKVTFGGKGSTTPVTLSNVAAGKADTDAVNVKQLTDAGLTTDSSGNVTNAFVAYDSAAKDLVTLAGASGTKITNLMAGTISASSKDAINGSQLYNEAVSTAAALGAGATVGADGKISAPAYKIGNKTYADVGSALNGLSGVSASLQYIAFGTSLDNAGNPIPAALATGQNSVAIGGDASAGEDNSFALGTNSRAYGLNSVVIGYGSSANGKNAVAIGANSVASADNTVSIGNSKLTRRIVNVAAGTGDTDAVNLGQVQSLLATQHSAVTTQLASLSQAIPTSRAAVVSLAATSSLTPDDLIAAGPTTNVTNSIQALGTDSIAIGLLTRANGVRSVAVGSNAIAGADSAVSVGYGTFVSGVQSAAFGYKANSISDRGLAMGNLAQINDSSPDAIAIGTRTQVNNDSAIGIGRDNLVNGLKSVVLGNDSTASGDGTFVIGNSVTKPTGKNSVVLGSGSDSSMDNVVSVGAKGSERKIVNVATGTADTDAVNVKQLNVCGPSGTP